MILVNNAQSGYGVPGLTMNTSTTCPHCGQVRISDNAANRKKNSRQGIVVCKNCLTPYKLSLVIESVSAVGVRLEDEPNLWSKAVTPIYNPETKEFQLKNFQDSRELPLWQIIKIAGKAQLKKYVNVPVFLEIDTETHHIDNYHYRGEQARLYREWEKSDKSTPPPSYLYTINSVKLIPISSLY